jgi:hypothetical protein
MNELIKSDGTFYKWNGSIGIAKQQKVMPPWEYL